MKVVCAAALAAVMCCSVAHASIGLASYYNSGRITANGEKFLPFGLTCAHRSLPFGTKLRVTNLKNGRSVIVRVNDRGPYINGRVLDLTLGAARMIGFQQDGVASVAYEVIN